MNWCLITWVDVSIVSMLWDFATTEMVSERIPAQHLHEVPDLQGQGAKQCAWRRRAWRWAATSAAPAAPRTSLLLCSSCIAARLRRTAWPSATRRSLKRGACAARLEAAAAVAEKRHLTLR